MEGVWIERKMGKKKKRNNNCEGDDDDSIGFD